MITNKKYLLFSFIFIASLSLHSFADHHDHFNFEEASIAECQACEENVEIKYVVPSHFLSNDKEEVLDIEAEHVKMLYLISKYATQARVATEDESWIREIPLMQFSKLNLSKF